VLHEVSCLGLRTAGLRDWRIFTADYFSPGIIDLDTCALEFFLDLDRGHRVKGNWRV
jgi:hypothetical protein